MKTLPTPAPGARFMLGSNRYGRATIPWAFRLGGVDGLPKRISRRRRSAAYWLSGGGMGCGVSRIALRSDGVNGDIRSPSTMNLGLPAGKPAKVHQAYPLA